MATVFRCAVLAAAPSAALLLAQKAVEAFSTIDARGRAQELPSRAALLANVERRQAEYDALLARRPAAPARKRRRAEFALADAKEDLSRHDISVWLAA